MIIITDLIIIMTKQKKLPSNAQKIGRRSGQSNVNARPCPASQLSQLSQLPGLARDIRANAGPVKFSHLIIIIHARQCPIINRAWPGQE